MVAPSRAMAGLFLASLLALRCAVTSPRSVTTTFAYDVGLESVERPADARERYGETAISTPDEAGKYWFEDGMIRSAWLVMEDRIGFEILNKTDHSIKIVWDEAAYVGTDSRSDRVVHEGIKFVDVNSPQPPTVIPKGGKLSDSVVPASDIWYGAISGWNISPLLLTKLYNMSLDGTVETLTKEEVVRDYEQKAIKLLLPLEIEGVVNEYTFTFRILRVTAVDVRSGAGGGKT